MSATLFGGIFGAAGVTAMIAELYLLKKVVDPLSSSMNILSDSFAKFVDGLTNTNLSLGIAASKNGIKELREEIQKFNTDDLSVLDKLGNLTTNISAGTETVKKKENNYAELTNAIVNAIRTGMSNIQITVDSNGNVRRSFTTETTTTVRPIYSGGGL